MGRYNNSEMCANNFCAYHKFFHNVLVSICTGDVVVSYALDGARNTTGDDDEGKKMEKRREPTSEGAGLTARPSG